MESKGNTRREAVGVFHDAASMEASIEALMDAGFGHSDVSLLASQHAIEEKLGHAYRRVSELEDDEAVPRTAYISTRTRDVFEGGLMFVGTVLGAGTAVVASGGLVAGVLISAVMAGGIGYLTSAALAMWMNEQNADHLQQQLDHGGLLLWVRTPNAEYERRAVDVLRRYAAGDVHVHDLSISDYAEKNANAGDLEKAFLDPTLVFEEPETLLKRVDLSSDQKIALLRRWASDVRALEVAENEGLVDSEPTLLDRIESTLHELEATSKIDRQEGQNEPE